MPPRRHRRRLTTEELSRVMGHAGIRFFTAYGCQRLWCEPKCDKQSMNRFQTSAAATRRHAGGRQRATTPREDRCIVLQVRRHPFVNAIALRNGLRNAVVVNIYTQTVRTCLRQSRLRSRRACICIPLTRLHKQSRLNWAQDQVKWTDNDWDPVLFTDE